MEIPMLRLIINDEDTGARTRAGLGQVSIRYESVSFNS